VKQFLIKYQFKEGSPEVWHERIRGFIAALENEPALKGKISYRCMRDRDGPQYYHLAEVSDDEAVRALQAQDFFKRYTEETRRVAGGEVVVTPLEVIAETAHRF
jgi:quinol monooxygenase YgiN